MNMTRGLWIVSLTAICSGTIQQGSASDIQANNCIPCKNKDFGNSNYVRYYLWPILEKSKMSAQINYVGECRVNDRFFPPAFPKVTLQLGSAAATGVDEVKELFRNDSNTTVVGTEGDKTVKILIGRVSEQLLETRIVRVHFGQIDQYNPAYAIDELENTREIRNAMHSLQITELSLPNDTMLVQPAEGIPHLPEYLNNITLGQALDVVANTFRGIVMYGECREGGIVHVNFFRNPYLVIQQ